MTRHRLYAFALALLCLLLDQISKQWVLELAGDPYPKLLREVTSFFNLVLVWNRGVSFGLFSDHPEWIPLLLIVFTGLVALILAVWLWRTPRLLTAYGLGLVIGGAVGNIVDRVRFGAVVDFLDFHVFGWHWPAFNVADSVIFMGVALLLVDTILESVEKKNEP